MMHVPITPCACSPAAGWLPSWPQCPRWCTCPLHCLHWGSTALSACTACTAWLGEPTCTALSALTQNMLKTQPTIIFASTMHLVNACLVPCLHYAIWRLMAACVLHRLPCLVCLQFVPGAGCKQSSMQHVAMAGHSTLEHSSRQQCLPTYPPTHLGLPVCVPLLARPGNHLCRCHRHAAAVVFIKQQITCVQAALMYVCMLPAADCQLHIALNHESTSELLDHSNILQIIKEGGKTLLMDKAYVQHLELTLIMSKHMQSSQYWISQPCC